MVHLKEKSSLTCHLGSLRLDLAMNFPFSDSYKLSPDLECQNFGLQMKSHSSEPSSCEFRHQLWQYLSVPSVQAQKRDRLRFPVNFHASILPSITEF